MFVLSQILFILIYIYHGNAPLRAGVAVVVAGTTAGTTAATGVIAAEGLIAAGDFGTAGAATSSQTRAADILRLGRADLRVHLGILFIHDRGG